MVLQTHATECGAACLGSVLAYHGRWVPLFELRERCGVGRDGSTAAGVARAGRHYGLECKGRSIDVGLAKRLRLPLILFWEFNHFVVLEGFDDKWFFLLDPASGRRRVSAEEFGRAFTGVALEFSRGADFEPGGTRQGLLQRIPLWFPRALGALSFVAGCGVLLAMLALLVPALVAVFVDWVLVNGEPWGAVVALALAAGAVVVYALTWVEQRAMHRLTLRTSILNGDRYLSHLLRLPMAFFNHRLAGDLVERLSAVDAVAVMLPGNIVGLAVQMVMTLVLLGVLLAFSPALALAVAALAVLHGAVTSVLLGRQADASYTWQREEGLLAGIGMLMVHQADNLRITTKDDAYFGRWCGHQAREVVARQRFQESEEIVETLLAVFVTARHAAVLVIGAAAVSAGEMTAGTFVGLYLVSGLVPPIGRLFSEVRHQRQAALTGMERLDDITDTPQESMLKERPEGAVATLNGRLRLAGHVELRGVSFGYTKGRPPLIRNFDLTIRPGQRIAVVGPSGSGKSTLSRLIAGIYQPWTGEILFDGRPRREIAEVVGRSVSMVDQHIVLFTGTVRDNLTLWSAAVPDEIMVRAARDACIHDDILSRPLGYGAPVVEGGLNFSGGQRQRLEIARALASDPTVLICDEATSALDATTEERVDDALRRRGMSCLIVAHRLSTVRDCDEIIVMEGGEIVQRGTHDELIADTRGLYSRLVRTH